MLKFSCVISCWSLVFVVLVLLHWTVLRSPNQINFYINNSKCTYRGGYLLVFSLALVLCRRCCYIYIFRPFFTLLAVFFLSFFIFFFLVWCVVCSLQLPAHTTLHIFNRVVAANLCMRRHKKVMDGFSKERSELKCIKFNAKKTGRIKRGKR